MNAILAGPPRGPAIPPSAREVGTSMGRWAYSVHGQFVRSATSLPREALVRAALAVAIEAPDVLGSLGALSAPALVLCGREDRGNPPGVSERMARAIPGARLEWIEGAGHLAPWERPEEVNRFLVPFVAERLA